MKGLRYLSLVVIIIGCIIFWRSENYSVEYLHGEYKGVAIGDSKQSVANLLIEKGIDGYSFITLEKDSCVMIFPISKGNMDEWFNSDIWILTKSDNGSYLKSIRIIFENNKVSKIDSWSRWFESP
ncbi:hypothetical protein [Umboniibacter marinipuniceus]|uniref:Lipoprotein n=1 Tax=Umboniibacter marinipuniceus TaxID=569599 RepID=A0A3M0AHW5_9GAMM|nr:hypothetical protein [Umboniibacter marinipuniceus]RMA82155.1 hypothetical protein DFR27_0102 [Umboniibacter marinipuniceus]